MQRARGRLTRPEPVEWSHVRNGSNQRSGRRDPVGRRITAGRHRQSGRVARGAHSAWAITNKEVAGAGREWRSAGGSGGVALPDVWFGSENFGLELGRVFPLAAPARILGLPLRDAMVAIGESLGGGHHARVG